MFRLLVVSASLAATAGFVSPRPSALGRMALRKAATPRAATPPMMLLGGLFGRGPASEAGGLADNEAASRMSPITVGIVGATGAVGEEIMGCLKERGVPVANLELFASARSAGKEIDTPFGKKTLSEFDLAAARKLDVVFLAVSGDFALEWAEKIAAGDDGALVIDNSSAFRYDERYPLVVPEINAEQGRSQKKGGRARLIANPNCTTAIAVMALWPLLKKYGLKRCIMSTYQAASGAGAPGMGELEDGVKAFTAGKEIKNEVFAHPLPFNVIPHIDKFQDNGYTKEEMKVTWECRKIMSQPNLAVSCTAVRIPTLRAHAEAITVETKRKVSPEDARALLKDAPGVRLADTPSDNSYPMPLTATKSYDVEVGRVRRSEVFGDYGLDLFVCGDQLLRGAALNAVLIAESVLAPPKAATT